jgi:hypothetical protein
MSGRCLSASAGSTTGDAETWLDLRPQPGFAQQAPGYRNNRPATMVANGTFCYDLTPVPCLPRTKSSSVNDLARLTLRQKIAPY